MRCHRTMRCRLGAALLGLTCVAMLAVDGRAQGLSPLPSAPPPPAPAEAKTPPSADHGQSDEWNVPPVPPFTPPPRYVTRPPVPPPTHPFRRGCYDGVTMFLAELFSPDFDPPVCCGGPWFDHHEPAPLDFYRHPHPPGPPDPLGCFFHTLNPAAVQYAIDRAWAHDISRFSQYAATPCIPEAMLFDQTGTLGVLKYYNAVEYSAAPIDGPLPTVQRLDFEYSPADWNLLTLDVTWQDQEPKRFTPGYQLTLGTGDGPWGSWVHGVELAVSHYQDEDFTGGRANWLFGWTPEKDSPLSAAVVLGASRTLAGELVPVLPAGQLGVAGPPGLPPDDGFWRGVVAGNLWYSLTPHFTVGIENDFFLHADAEEHLILPHVNWTPIEHVRVQVGGGWYRLGDQHERLLMVRVALFNPSPRVAQ